MHIHYQYRMKLHQYCQPHNQHHYYHNNLCYLQPSHWLYIWHLWQLCQYWLYQQKQLYLNVIFQLPCHHHFHITKNINVFPINIYSTNFITNTSVNISIFTMNNLHIGLIFDNLYILLHYQLIIDFLHQLHHKHLWQLYI